MRPVPALFTFLAVASALLFAATAQAETFVVSTCSASAQKGAGAWVYNARPGTPAQSGDLCDSEDAVGVGSFNRSATRAFWATTPTPIGTPAAAAGRVAGFTITASPGATIKRITLDRRLATRSGNWELRLMAGANTTLESCVGPSSTICADAHVAATGSYSSMLSAGTTSVDLAAWCVAAISCAYVGGAEPTFAGALESGTIEVSESTPPSATIPYLGSSRGGTASPDDTLTFAGSDPLGLRKLELLSSGQPVATLRGSCVDWAMRPCVDGPGGSVGLTRTATLDDLDLAGGTHTLRTRATDAAGNVTVSDATTVTVEYPAIIATGLSGGGPSNEAVRALSWSVGGDRPVASAAVELCPVDEPRSCTRTATEAEGPFTFFSESFPDVNATVLLRGEDGSVGRSEPMRFTYDITPPQPPTLALVGSNGLTRIVQVTIDPTDTDVASLRPRLCTHRQNVCTVLPQLEPAERVAVELPGPGALRYDIELVDAAGNIGLAGQIDLQHTGPIGGGGVAGPGRGAATAKGRPITLVPLLPKKLGTATSVLIRGKLDAGSSPKVTVTLAGRNTAKKAAKTVKAVRPKADGTFAVRVKVPKRLDRRKGLLVTVEAAPAAGWLAAKQRTRLR